MKKIPCPELGCENGEVDSGGMMPWGEWIKVPCGLCDGKGYVDLLDDITDAERAHEYKSMLSYVLANLSHRKERPDSCATDEFLIKYIKRSLSDEGLAMGVTVSRQIKKITEETIKELEERNATGA